MPNKRRFFRK